MGKDEPKPVERRVLLTQHCEREYRKLHDSIKRLVEKTLKEISVHPEIGYSLTDRVFKDKDLYSIHCGDIRIIYRFSHNPGEVEVWAIAHRNHIYEDLQRYRSISS